MTARRLGLAYRYAGRQCLQGGAYVLCTGPGQCVAGQAQLVWVGSATAAIVQVQVRYRSLGNRGPSSQRIVALLTWDQFASLRFPAVPWGSGPGLIAF